MNTKERGLTLLGRYIKFNETDSRKYQLLNFTILGNGNE